MEAGGSGGGLLLTMMCAMGVLILSASGGFALDLRRRPDQPEVLTAQERAALHKQTRLRALQVKALALLPIPMKGEAMDDLQREMAENLAAIASYHDSMRAALGLEALDAQEAAARNDAMMAARRCLLSAFGDIHAPEAITLIDRALCLPPVLLELD